MILNYINNNEIEGLDSADTPTPVPTKKSIQIFDFNEMSIPQTNNTLLKEFLEYECICIEADLDILKQFRKSNEKKFPLLSRVVKRFMCAQATSTPSERLFSAAVYNIWDRRCNLKPSKVNKMMVLYQFDKNLAKQKK
jgi:hypothetical protein